MGLLSIEQVCRHSQGGLGAKKINLICLFLTSLTPECCSGAWCSLQHEFKLLQALILACMEAEE